MFDDKEPTLNDRQQKIFNNLKRPLIISKNKSKNAKKQIKKKSNQNQIKIKSKSNQNQIETSATKSMSMSMSNNNINKYIKYGKYKRIKLTKEEYQRLIDEYGEDFITDQIDLLDEYVESNNNKNKYSNFNLVLRKSIREGWFKEKTANTPGWFDKKNDTKKMTGEEEQEFENIMEGILNDKNRTNSV